MRNSFKRENRAWLKTGQEKMPAMEGDVSIVEGKGKVRGRWGFFKK